MLQFGRVGSDSFTMDYAYPMSAAQVCLSAMSPRQSLFPLTAALSDSSDSFTVGRFHASVSQAFAVCLTSFESKITCE